MKLGLVFATLLLVACTKTVTSAKAPKPALATADDCNKVYNRLCAIAVRDSMDPDNEYSPEEHQAAMELVDQHYRENGTSEKFFVSCMGRANTDQTQCMANANDLQSVKLCAQLFETKKNP
jgi:hypothetical protein